jgi:3-hydroxyisobutyrate dehydrogenase/2-hydroxy-3-oxopropionate reductase
MAANLARSGFAVRLYNRDTAKAEAVAAEVGSDGDAVVCATPAEAAEKAEVVVTMLADGRAVDAVYHGPDGVLARIPPGALAIEMSTSGRDAVLSLAAALADAGCALVDAPVSGSVAFARDGKLTIMAGGSDADVARARAVLDVLGGRVFHVGPLGSGAAMKLVVNTVIYGLNQAVSEALVLAERAGIERKAAYAVFAESAVAAPFVHYRRDAFERPETAPPAMRIDLAAKDLDLIIALARSVDAPVPQAGLNLDVLYEASEAGFGADDVALVAEFLRRRA